MHIISQNLRKKYKNTWRGVKRDFKLLYGKAVWSTKRCWKDFGVFALIGSISNHPYHKIKMCGSLWKLWFIYYLMWKLYHINKQTDNSQHSGLKNKLWLSSERCLAFQETSIDTVPKICCVVCWSTLVICKIWRNTWSLPIKFFKYFKKYQLTFAVPHNLKNIIAPQSEK